MRSASIPAWRSPTAPPTSSPRTTSGWTYFRAARTRALSALLLLLATAAGAAESLWAPRAGAGPVDQLEIAGNACGPAALLAAIRCGDDRWRALAETIPGAGDREKLLYIIRAHGLKPSTTLRDQRRWTREGINAEDLAAVAGELASFGDLPAPRSESLLRRSGESAVRLTHRIHGLLRDSLEAGFPPVLSLRRYVFRDGRWEALQGHFVTIVRVPAEIDPRVTFFSFTYFEPWGGKRDEGSLHLPEDGVLGRAGDTAGCLEARVPAARIGRGRVRPGERSVIVPTIVTGLR